MGGRVAADVAHILAASARWSATHPAIAIASVLAVTLLLGAGMTQAEQGRIQDLFVPDGLPAQATLETIGDIWGQSDASLFLYIVDDPSDPGLLRAVAEDAGRLRAQAVVQDVGGLPVLLESQLGDLGNIPDAQLREAAQGLIKSPAGSALAVDDALLLRISIEPGQDVVATTALLDSIAAQSSADGDLRSAGPLYVERMQQDSGNADVALLMPLSVATIVLVLSLLFRRLRDVLVPMVVSFLALAMAYGTVAWAGLPLAPPSFITMPLLLGLGIDYMLHIIYAYREQPEAWPVPRRFEAAAGHVGAPVFFTALTTLIGFGSFLASNIPQIRVWGLLIGSGALYAFILGFIALPAFYRIGRRRRAKTIALPLGTILEAWSHVVVRQRVPVLIVVAIVTLGLAAAATTLDVEAELAFELDENAPELADLAAVEDRFGGQTTAQILIPADDRQGLERLETALDGIAGLGFIDGPVHRLQQAGDPDGPLVQGLTEGVATAAWWRITVGYAEGDDGAVDAVRDLVAEGPAGAKLTGRDIIDRESRDVVLQSLFMSTGIALVLVLVLLLIVFRDLRASAIAFVPLLITIVWQTGIQALVGIPLNPITGVIIAMTLGIGVDYALHIMAHFRQMRRFGRQEAARRAVASVGRPVLAATLTTVLAFSVLGFSSLLPLQQFGYTAAIVILCAFIVSLTFLPAFASLGATKARSIGQPRVVPSSYQGPRQVLRPRPTEDNAFVPAAPNVGHGR